MRDGYTTPEGFWLARPLLMPDARSFADVLTLRGEWSHARGYVPPCEPVRMPAGGKGGEIIAALIGPPDPRDRNEIGPFGVIETLDCTGPRRRAVALEPTPAALEAIAARGLVTSDDRLSWQIIIHPARDDRPSRALVILSHGAIIGSLYVAYVDPATIPPYPFAARDRVGTRLYRALEDAGRKPMQTDRGLPDVHACRYVTRDGSGLEAIVYPDGSVRRVWGDGTETLEPAPADA